MHINEVKNKIADVLSNLKDAEIKQRGYLLTGDSLFLHSFSAKEEDISRDFAALGSLIRDSRQQENLKKLKTIVEFAGWILSVGSISLHY